MLLESGALPTSVANGAAAGYSADDQKQLSDLLAACLPDSPASCPEMASIIVEVSRVLANSRMDTQVRLTHRS